MLISCGIGPDYVEISTKNVKDVFDAAILILWRQRCLWRFKVCGHWYWLRYGYQPAYQPANWNVRQRGDLQGLSSEILPYQTGYIEITGPSIKIKLFAVPLPTHFFPPTQNFLLHFWKIQPFFNPIFIRKSQFSHYAALKEKKVTKKIYIIPTYLPNLNIQGRGTANKQFFKDGPRDKANSNALANVTRRLIG